MKIRVKLIPILALALIFTVVVILPQIIEAKRDKAVAPDQGQAATAQGPKDDRPVTVGASVRNDTSIPLREMKQKPIEFKPEREANENPKIPHSHKNAPDKVVQRYDCRPGSSLRLTCRLQCRISTALGFRASLVTAPLPIRMVKSGATQYVQIVNEGFQVFDKTGTSLLGPSGIATLWSGFGGVCQSNGDGDPVVLYDQLADRWIISQFAGVSVPTDECIAVSTTGDATGSYYRYDFHLGSNFFDYPHLSVWPDGYYMSMNVFNSAGSAFLGPQAFAFDRAKMLQGLACYLRN